MILPSSTTTMREALRAVCNRWAINNVVRPFEARFIARCTTASVARSRLDVASSRIRMLGSISCARARHNSWRWPADSERPVSATGVR